jgi:hypothetical protein
LIAAVFQRHMVIFDGHYEETALIWHQKCWSVCFSLFRYFRRLFLDFGFILE